MAIADRHADELATCSEHLEEGVTHSYRYDQVCDPLSGPMKYCCLYHREGEDLMLVLVNSPNRGGGRVILFDDDPGTDVQAS